MYIFFVTYMYKNPSFKTSNYHMVQAMVQQKYIHTTIPPFYPIDLDAVDAFPLYY